MSLGSLLASLAAIKVNVSLICLDICFHPGFLLFCCQRLYLARLLNSTPKAPMMYGSMMLLSLTIPPIAALLPTLAAAASTGKALRPVPESPSLPFEPAMQEQPQPLLFSQEANRLTRKHHPAVLALLSLPFAAVAVSFIVFTCYKALTASRTGASNDLGARRLAQGEEGLCSVSRLDSEQQITANTQTNEHNEDVCLLLMVSCFCLIASNVELLQW